MGNELWETKNEYYFQKAPFKTQLELSNYVKKEIKKWDETSITSRQQSIINFAVDYWATEEEKSKKEIIAEREIGGSNLQNSL